jgi:hypothetical protein
VSSCRAPRSSSLRQRGMAPLSDSETAGKCESAARSDASHDLRRRFILDVVLRLTSLRVIAAAVVVIAGVVAACGSKDSAGSPALIAVPVPTTPAHPIYAPAHGAITRPGSVRMQQLSVSSAFGTQRTLHHGQQYLPWTVISVDTVHHRLVLSWDNTRGPAPSSCSQPTASQVEQTAARVVIGLIGPRPDPAAACAETGLSMLTYVQLDQPLGPRPLYRLTN